MNINQKEILRLAINKRKGEELYFVYEFIDDIFGLEYFYKICDRLKLRFVKAENGIYFYKPLSR